MATVDERQQHKRATRRGDCLRPRGRLHSKKLQKTVSLTPGCLAAAAAPGLLTRRGWWVALTKSELCLSRREGPQADSDRGSSVQAVAGLLRPVFFHVRGATLFCRGMCHRCRRVLDFLNIFSHFPVAVVSILFLREASKSTFHKSKNIFKRQTRS